MTDKKKLKKQVRARMKLTGESYTTALRALTAKAARGATAPPIDHRGDFRAASLGKWKEFFDSVTETRCSSTGKIVEILNEAGSRTNNHILFARGGGLDLSKVKVSHEANCIELVVSGQVQVLRPKHLTVHRVTSDPSCEWSYLWLELAPLSPSGVYASGELGDLAHEEVTEIAPGEYEERSVAEEYFYEDRGVPHAFEPRVVTRCFSGPMVIVTKGGGYNTIDREYRGRHARLGEDAFLEQMTDVVASIHERDLYGVDPMEWVRRR